MGQLAGIWYQRVLREGDQAAAEVYDGTIGVVYGPYSIVDQNLDNIREFYELPGRFDVKRLDHLAYSHEIDSPHNPELDENKNKSQYTLDDDIPIGYTDKVLEGGQDDQPTLTQQGDHTMITQGHRKLYSAEEKETFLQLYNERWNRDGDEPDMQKFAKECEVPYNQFRLWRQLAASGMPLQDSKPLPHTTGHKVGNGKDKAESKNAGKPHFTDPLTKTYWAQQLLRARVAGTDRVTEITEVFQKATGFAGPTIGNWTREYLTTPKGKKFQADLIPPKPKPVKVKKGKYAGRPAHSRYLDPETKVPQTKLHPEYWNKLIELVTALDKDLRNLIFRMDTQTKKLEELQAMWQ